MQVCIDICIEVHRDPIPISDPSWLQGREPVLYCCVFTFRHCLCCVHIHTTVSYLYSLHRLHACISYILQILILEQLIYFTPFSYYTLFLHNIIFLWTILVQERHLCCVISYVWAWFPFLCLLWLSGYMYCVDLPRPYQVTPTHKNAAIQGTTYNSLLFLFPCNLSQISW